MKTLLTFKKEIEKNKGKSLEIPLNEKYAKIAERKRAKHLTDCIISEFTGLQDAYITLIATKPTSKFKYSSNYKNLLIRVKACHVDDWLFTFHPEVTRDAFYTYTESEFMTGLLGALTQIVNAGFTVYLNKGSDVSKVKFTVVVPSENASVCGYTHTVSSTGELIEYKEKESTNAEPNKEDEANQESVE